MNPLLSSLQPYPFERLRQLFEGTAPPADRAPISLGMGEPGLRAAFTDWLQRRYGLALDPASQVLPVNGSREALFAFAQTVVDASCAPAPLVVCPNPL